MIRIIVVILKKLEKLLKNSKKKPMNISKVCSHHCFQLLNKLIIFFFFLEKNYEAAIDLYSRAIDVYPHSAVYFANRSFAQLRMENYGYALEDASKAIENDKKYIKVWSMCPAFLKLLLVSNL